MFNVGDPEWIGILAHPDQRHSSSNYFIARYAYVAQPIGNSLDVNYIHNNTKQLTPEGFRRNLGVGSWELNLAGFLYFLNTNDAAGLGYGWGPVNNYLYTANVNSSSGGSSAAFQDAAGLLSYRSGTIISTNANLAYPNYANLAYPNQYYPPAAVTAFGAGSVDYYALGTLWSDTHPYLFSGLTPNTLHWAGFNNPRHLFTSQDYYSPPNAVNANIYYNSFSNHLYRAGVAGVQNATRDSYNRYTYYRMLSQMGWDSAPESPGKVHLNYRNMGVNPFTGAPYAPTNFIGLGRVELFHQRRQQPAVGLHEQCPGASLTSPPTAPPMPPPTAGTPMPWDHDLVSTNFPVINIALPSSRPASAWRTFPFTPPIIIPRP